jgi:Protein of unknown function (DUF2865)
MIEIEIAKLLRAPCAGLAILFLCAAPAAAQYGYPPSAAPGAARNQTCVRLESQLAALDRGITGDPARAEQVRRYEDAAAKQQAELDRLGQQSQKLGCQGGGFFALFSGQSPQCGPVNNQIQQMRANLDRTLTEIQRLQGNSGEREGQRRGLLAALGQNDCGPQYRRYATGGPGGFFDALFGGTYASPVPDGPPSGTYRTLCVRTCDGYYFPISYSTVPSKFPDDEQLCRRLCPATEVTLYSHRNPGGDVNHAVSISGRPYTDLPTAFSYRKTYNAACSCRAPGQSWADALRQGGDQTVERGDIVVTEERAKLLSQPRASVQGKASTAASAAPPPSAETAAASAAPAAEDKPEDAPGKRKVRAVGPNIYPVR